MEFKESKKGTTSGRIQVESIAPLDLNIDQIETLPYIFRKFISRAFACRPRGDEILRQRDHTGFKVDSIDSDVVHKLDSALEKHGVK